MLFKSRDPLTLKYTLQSESRTLPIRNRFETPFFRNSVTYLEWFSDGVIDGLQREAIRRDGAASGGRQNALLDLPLRYPQLCRRQLLLAVLQTGRLERNDRRLVAHVAETLRQRLVLRAQVRQTEGLQPRSSYLALVEALLRFGTHVLPQAATGEIVPHHVTKLRVLTRADVPSSCLSSACPAWRGISRGGFYCRGAAAAGVGCVTGWNERCRSYR